MRNINFTEYKGLYFAYQLTNPFTAADPLDVVLLLDSSDGHRSENFAEERTFAKKLTQQLWDNGNRVGLFTFGSTTHQQFSLNTYRYESDAVTAIRYMWYSTGTGNLENALEFTLHNGFTAESGERDCVPNIIVVLTHSGLTNSALLTSIKEKIKQLSVSIIIIDMTHRVHDSGFHGVTGNISSIIDCANYQTLQTLPSMIVNKVKSGIINCVLQNALSKIKHELFFTKGGHFKT